MRRGWWVFCMVWPCLAATADSLWPAPEVPAGWSDLQPAGSPGWHYADEVLRCELPAGQKDAYETFLPTMLPPQDWTIDLFWMVDGDAHPNVSLLLRPGVPGPLGLKFTLDGDQLEIRRDHKLEYLPLGAERHRDALKGPHLWLRIACRGLEQRLQVWANGCRVPLEDDRAQLLMGRVGMRVDPRYELLRAAAVEVRFLSISRGLPEQPAPAAGLAYDGLDRPAEPPAELTTEVLAKLDRTAEDPSAGWTGQVYAATARQLAAWALQEPPGGPAWQRLGRLVGETPPRCFDRLEGLATAIPLAVATSRDAERDEAKVWADRLLAGLAEWYHYPSRADQILVRRIALLDPLAAAELGQEGTVAPDILEQILAHATPERAPAMVGLICRQIDDGGSGAWAWMLPELLRAEPRFAALAAARIDRGDQYAWFSSAEPNHGYANGAWRLAAQDAELAWRWCHQIDKLSERADALRLVLDRIPEPTDAQLDEVEAMLRQAIAEFKPYKRDPSPVRLYCDLCRWQYEHRRIAAAAVTFDEAVTHIATDPVPRFRDTWRLYTLLKQRDAPETAEWLQRAIEAEVPAREADDTDESQYAPSEFYVSSTAQLVTELIRLGRLEEATERIHLLDPQRHVLGLAMSLSFLIRQVMKTDVQYALKLYENLPDERGYRRGLRLPLAIAAFEDHRAAARALIDEVAEPARTAQWFQVLAANRGLDDDMVRGLFAEAVAADVARLGDHPTRWLRRGAVMRMVNDVPPARLLELKPGYQDDLEIYGRQWLHTTATACGLGEDPVWLQVREEAWVSEGYPFGASLLRYTVQNLEDEE